MVLECCVPLQYHQLVIQRDMCVIEQILEQYCVSRSNKFCIKPNLNFKHKFVTEAIISVMELIFWTILCLIKSPIWFLTVPFQYYQFVTQTVIILMEQISVQHFNK